MADTPLDVGPLLERVAQSLTTNVLPNVTDHYARAQLRAACELVANVGSRVEWRRDAFQLRARTLSAAIDSAALGTLGALRAPETRPPDAADVAVLLGRLAAAIEQIYAASTTDEHRAAALDEVWRVVRTEFDADAERIRTGMFS